MQNGGGQLEDREAWLEDLRKLAEWNDDLIRRAKSLSVSARARAPSALCEMGMILCVRTHVVCVCVWKLRRNFNSVIANAIHKINECTARRFRA